VMIVLQLELKKKQSSFIRACSQGFLT